MNKTLAGFACVAVGLGMAACASSGGGSADIGARCAGSAYQASFQGTTEYTPEGRSEVSGIMRGLADPANPGPDAERRLGNAVGTDMVPLFMSNYQPCVAEAQAEAAAAGM